MSNRVPFLCMVFARCRAVVGQYLDQVWCLVADSAVARPLPGVIQWCGTTHDRIKCHYYYCRVVRCDACVLVMVWCHSMFCQEYRDYTLWW